MGHLCDSAVDRPVSHWEPSQIPLCHFWLEPHSQWYPVTSEYTRMGRSLALSIYRGDFVSSHGALGKIRGCERSKIEVSPKAPRASFRQE